MELYTKFKAKVTKLECREGRFIYYLPSLYCEYIGTDEYDRITLKFHDTYGSIIAVDENYFDKCFEKV